MSENGLPWEAVMSDGQTHSYEPSVPMHPICPTCGVPMWMTFIEHIPGPPIKNCLHYECMACDAKTVLPMRPAFP